MRIIPNLDMGFSLSSQTTSGNLRLAPSEAYSSVHITNVTHDAESIIVEVADRSWDEVAEEVLRDRAQVWQRLANL